MDSFDYDMSVSQGRIVPANASAVKTSGALVGGGVEPYDFAALGSWGVPPSFGVALSVTVNGGTPQEVFFIATDFPPGGGAAATAAQVVTVINTGGMLGAGNRLVGATASVATGPVVRITTDTSGATGSIQVNAPVPPTQDANTLLLFAPGVAVPGTGGNYLYVLGSDLIPAAEYDPPPNTTVALQQNTDLTGIDLISATWICRQPSSMHNYVDILAAVAPGTVAIQVSFYSGITLRAYLAIGSIGPLPILDQVRYWAKTPGAPGALVQVGHYNPGAINQPLQVLAGGTTIKIYLETNGVGAVVSTADEVAAAVNAHPGANALVTARAALPGTATVATLLPAANLILTNDKLTRIVTSVNYFTQEHVGWPIRITGSAAGNDGDYHIAVVLDARNAVVDTALNAEGAGGGWTLVSPGRRWRCRALVDRVERGVVTEYPPARGDRSIVRTDMQAHVSKLTGTYDVTFELAMTETT